MISAAHCEGFAGTVFSVDPASFQYLCRPSEMVLPITAFLRRWRRELPRLVIFCLVFIMSMDVMLCTQQVFLHDIICFCLRAGTLG